MAGPVKWSRDLHPIRERARNARIETWGRKDIEDLFGVGRATAQTLMKAIGEIQAGGRRAFRRAPFPALFPGCHNRGAFGRGGIAEPDARGRASPQAEAFARFIAR